MKLEFDREKREQTLLARGLDFARAHEVFKGVHFTGQDTRMNYSEDRFITVGWLDDRPGLDPARRGAPHHQHEESE